MPSFDDPSASSPWTTLAHTIIALVIFAGFFYHVRSSTDSDKTEKGSTDPTGGITQQPRAPAVFDFGQNLSQIAIQHAGSLATRSLADIRGPVVLPPGTVVIHDGQIIVVRPPDQAGQHGQSGTQHGSDLGHEGLREGLQRGKVNASCGRDVSS